MIPVWLTTPLDPEEILYGQRKYLTGKTTRSTVRIGKSFKSRCRISPLCGKMLLPEKYKKLLLEVNPRSVQLYGVGSMNHVFRVAATDRDQSLDNVANKDTIWAL